MTFTGILLILTFIFVVLYAIGLFWYLFRGPGSSRWYRR